MQVKEENEDLVERMEELARRYQHAENDLVKYKLMSAELDMECDQLTVDNKNKIESLKKFSAKFAKLEVQLIEAQANAGMFSMEDDQIMEPEKKQSQVAVSPRKTKVSEKIKGFFGSKPLWK